MNTANCIADVVYRLGFLNAADLDTAGTWVTSTELYQWVDEAVKTLSYRLGLFVALDGSITVSADVPLYQEPARQNTTLAVWLGTQSLRMTGVKELRALDATWPTTTGTPTRCSMDAGKDGTITLYPKPTVGGTLWQLWQEHPPDVTAGAANLAFPTVFQDYFSYRILAAARGKESDAMQAEMAKHFESRCAMYEKIIAHLYS